MLLALGAAGCAAEASGPGAMGGQLEEGPDEAQLAQHAQAVERWESSAISTYALAYYRRWLGPSNLPDGQDARVVVRDESTVSATFEDGRNAPVRRMEDVFDAAYQALVDPDHDDVRVEYDEVLGYPKATLVQRSPVNDDAWRMLVICFSDDGAALDDACAFATLDPSL